MGDLIELETWPSHPTVFYKISSSGLAFEVQGEDCAAVGLAKRPGIQCDFWVVIGCNGRSWIKKQDNSGKSVRTPNILSSMEYRRFWISWKNGHIQFGRNDDRTPLVSHTINSDLNYVTFSSGDSHNVGPANLFLHWRFELPPVLEKPKLKPVVGGELQWFQTDDHLPDGALIGGYEKETLYIIRAPHRGSMTPGKFVPSEGTGYISWGGSANEKNEFEVLCGFNCTWVPTYDDRIPVGAVVGGYSEGHEREKLYVGRALYNGHLIPGKVQPSHNVCYIPYEGREIGQKRYEILVSPDVNPRSANRIFINHIDVDSAPESENEDFGMENAYHDMNVDYIEDDD